MLQKNGINTNQRQYYRMTVKLLWDFSVQRDRLIEHMRPDIVVVDKTVNKCFIIDVAVPGDQNLVKKKWEKLNNYAELWLEIARIWNKETIVVPIIIGALESVPKDIHHYLKQLHIPYQLNTLQHSVLLGTANILRKVL